MITGQNKTTRNNSVFFKPIVFALVFLGAVYIFRRAVTWTYKDAVPYMEWLGISFVIIALLSLKPIQIYTQAIPRKLKCFYTGLFFIFCFFQLAGVPRSSFPFIPWQMFSYPRYTSEVYFYEYRGVTQSGQDVKLYPPRYFKPLSSGRIETDLDNLMNLILYGKQEDALYQKQQYDLIVENSPVDGKGLKGSLKNLLSRIRLGVTQKPLTDLEEMTEMLNQRLKAVGNRYNAQSPHDPLVKINVIEGLIDIQTRPKPKVDRKKVWEVNL